MRNRRSIDFVQHTNFEIDSSNYMLYIFIPPIVATKRSSELAPAVSRARYCKTARSRSRAEMRRHVEIGDLRALRRSGSAGALPALMQGLTYAFRQVHSLRHLRGQHIIVSHLASRPRDVLAVQLQFGIGHI